MATVDLALDEQLGRRIAIKRLSPAFTDDEVFRERFLREARVAAQLSHPNIVAVYDVGEDERGPYIVMEYVEGETLADVLSREGRLPPDRAVDFVLQVCAGLEHAHAAGLVHRDIKPRNLLVRDGATVKIADFGIARPAGATRLTEIGTVLGTAAYLAPEQASGSPVTGAADIYSLGAVTYELLSGKPPYEFETLVELAVKQHNPPPAMDGVPPELEAVVLRCLAFDPEARPRSAAAAAHELAQASPEPPTERLPVSEVAAATSVTAATRVMDTPPSRTIHVSRRTALAVAAALALALLVGGLALAYDGGGGDGGGGTEAPPAENQPARPDVVPRGDTPAESADRLADWLRERAG